MSEEGGGGVGVLAVVFQVLLMGWLGLFTLAIVTAVMDKIYGLFVVTPDNPLYWVVATWNSIRDAALPLVPALAIMGVVLLALFVVGMMLRPRRTLPLR